MHFISRNFSIEQAIEMLGPWFHNVHLPGGIQTAPNHYLGDFPDCKWQQIKSHIPADLTGWKCLDVGCNAGFYSIELAKRGADVLGIDSSMRYIGQATLATQALRLKNPPRFRQMQVHELARRNETYDLVLFMGVFYHLRYPALALDTVSRLVGKTMIFQSLTMEADEQGSPPPEITPKGDYSLEKRDMFQQPGWPKLAFIEHMYVGDPSNWWIPNHSAIMGMLRSTGFEKVQRISHETYLCTPPARGILRARTWNDEEWYGATGAQRPGPAMQTPRRSTTASSSAKNRRK